MSVPLNDAMPDQLTAILDAAISEAKRRGHDRVTPAHVATVLQASHPEIADPAFDDAVDAAFAAYLESLPRTFNTPVADQATIESVRASALLPEPLVALADGLRQVAPTLKDEPAPQPPPFELPAGLQGYAAIVDATAPGVPRDDVVRRLLSLLNSRDPQTPLVVAAQGHGRTGLARCLAATLRERDHAGTLGGWPLVRVRPEGIINDGRRDALKQVLEFCRGKAVVYIDDVEVLCSLGGGGADWPMMFALRSAIRSPGLHVVLTIASEFVDRLQTSDLEMFDELHRVDLIPMTDAEVLAIAQAAAGQFAEYHHVTIGPDVVVAASAPARQIDSRGHPALAVERLDRAAAAATLNETRVASVADLGSAVAGQQYLSFDPDAANERLKLRVMGQDEAVEAVTNRLAITRATLDMRPERPDGVFLFAGPTGVGKTELALSLAQEVYGTQEAMIRLDMSEYSEEYAVNKLIGSPPGYIGSTEPESWLTTKVRRHPQSVLLLDEIEKAHPKIWNTFLQVFDAGRLTDSQGRIADFRDVIVVMTTNMGSDAFADRNVTGFLPSAGSATADRQNVLADIKQHMRPELLNRLDEILVFHPLTPEIMRRIVDKQLADAVARLGDRGWHVTIAADVPDALAALGYSKEYGARPLIRVIEARLVGRVRRLPAGNVVISVAGGDIVAAEAQPEP